MLPGNPSQGCAVVPGQTVHTRKKPSLWWENIGRLAIVVHSVLQYTRITVYDPKCGSCYDALWKGVLSYVESTSQLI